MNRVPVGRGTERTGGMLRLRPPARGRGPAAAHPWRRPVDFTWTPSRESPRCRPSRRGSINKQE